MLVTCVFTEILLKCFPLRNYLVNFHEICSFVPTQLSGFSFGLLHTVHPILRVKLKSNFRKIFSERSMCTK